MKKCPQPLPTKNPMKQFSIPHQHTLQSLTPVNNTIKLLQVENLKLELAHRKRTEYNKVISCFEKKYQKDFGDFSKSLTNCAAVEEEDDWMEWKGAIEMLKGWDEAYRLSIHGQAV